MCYKSVVLVAVYLAFGSLNTNGQELTKTQKEPWSALETQVGLWFKQDWKNHEKYIHPKSIDWDDESPAPVSGAKAMDYVKVLLKGTDKVVAHHMTPVTVIVVDDVAIINCYLQVLTRKDGQMFQATYRLHNTWKKEDGRWLLLATCNGVVKKPEPVE